MGSTTAIDVPTGPGTTCKGRRHPLAELNGTSSMPSIWLAELLPPNSPLCLPVSTPHEHSPTGGLCLSSLSSQTHLSCCQSSSLFPLLSLLSSPLTTLHRLP